MHEFQTIISFPLAGESFDRELIVTGKYSWLRGASIFINKLEVNAVSIKSGARAGEKLPSYCDRKELKEATKKQLIKELEQKLAKANR